MNPAHPMPKRVYLLPLLIVILIVINIFLFSVELKAHDRRFTFAMLDVGQGDTLFIESPTGTQILFDTGSPRRVLGPLKKLMSPFDRSIDAVILTNPDADHIGGMLDVMKYYKVGAVFEPGTTNESKIYQNLEKEIQGREIERMLAKKGMRLHIGGGAFIDILFPDRDVSTWSVNEGSIVARLVYGETSVMLTGDATMETEKIILSQFKGEQLKSTILKVGHHGSRTSTGEQFVNAVAPSYALISSGKDNRYGHPHEDVLQVLHTAQVETLRTDLLGTIIMKSDGVVLQCNQCETKK